MRPIGPSRQLGDGAGPRCRLGDVIVDANGKAVRRLSDLTDTIEELGVGKSVEITALRDGQRRTIQIDIVDIGRS